MTRICKILPINKKGFLRVMLIYIILEGGLAMFAGIYFVYCFKQRRRLPMLGVGLLICLTIATGILLMQA